MHNVFGDFSLDTARYELRHAGSVVPLRGKVFDVLAYLVTHHERVVSRDELLEQVWPEQFIAESTLTSCIKAVRQALGDTGRTQHLIKTVHGRGYRCLAPVTELEPAAPEPSSPQMNASIQSVLEASSAHEDQSMPVATAQPVAERRQLTVLNVELVDAAALTVALDPEALHGLMQAFHAACIDLIAPFDGFVAYQTEHGMVVYFGYPQAHEDDALRAVRAALAIVATVPTLPTANTAPPAVQLSVRIGIHTGEVVTESLVEEDERMAFVAMGATPTIAHGLRQWAEPHTVVVSETTAHLVQGYVEWKQLAPYQAASPSRALEVYRILSRASPSSTHPRSKPRRSAIV